MNYTMYSISEKLCKIVFTEFTEATNAKHFVKFPPIWILFDTNNGKEAKIMRGAHIFHLA